MKAIGKVFGIIMLAAILVGFGTAMAMWSETLRTNVYIDTGEVKVEWSEWYCSDTGPDPQAPGYNNDEGKDVASCNVEPEIIDDGNVIKLNVTIDNAYPGYTTSITMVVDNIGTVPVKLLSYNLIDVNESALQVRLIAPDDTQIEPDGSSTYILEITVLQTAPENASYSFELQMDFAQWNEVPSAGL